MIKKYTYMYYKLKNYIDTINIEHINILKTKKEYCIICMENENNIATNCFHYFCKNCLIEWFKINNFCPLCRNNNIKCFNINYI